MTSCRHSKGLFLPAEEGLMRLRNRICKSCLWDKRNYSFFSSTFCCFFFLTSTFCYLCCLSVVPAIRWAVRLVRMAFHRSGTALHMVGSRCSRCIHTHSTERPFSSSWHLVKSHTQMTWRSKGCFCHDLCVAADPPPPQHIERHYHCSSEACAHLPLSHAEETQWLPFLCLASPWPVLFIWSFALLLVQRFLI